MGEFSSGAMFEPDRARDAADETVERVVADEIDGFPQQLGCYRRDERLGAGGMGVVYRYRDTRLDRFVAVKRLPQHRTADAVWRARFVHEAQILASLNHPNIAKIHHLHERQGVDFLILEYVPGPTLGALLRDGPLEWSRALHVGGQICRGIAAGHAEGIIHRDIKPGNVIIREGDVAMILDYGLAHLLRHEPSARRTTEGTPGYMGPEQISGEIADERTDVWAWGCLLFECLAGRPAFPGETPEARIEATLRSEPEWHALPASLPDQVREHIEDCLCKDPSMRPVGLADIAAEFERIAELGAPRPVIRSVPGNLPGAPAGYIEREGELESLSRMLDDTRLLTLTGPGGCGKTSLSLAIMHRLADAERRRTSPRHPEGLWIVRLGPVHDGDLVAQAIAATLCGRRGIGHLRGRPILDGLVDDIGDRRMLLVLDNCEHVIRGCADAVARLLEECPGLRIIATSRLSLGVPGEQVYPVPALTYPTNGARGLLAGYESVRLLLDRIGRVQPRFAITRDNASAVATICRRLEGIPLAIELAAARIGTLAVTDVADRLFDVLHTAHALETSITSSVELLGQAQVDLLGRLSVFSGGWTLEAAEAVCADRPGKAAIRRRPVVDLLGELVRHSLVRYEVGGRRARYHLLETVREHTRALVRSRWHSRLRRRHFEYFLGVAEEADANLAGPDQVEWFDRLDIEHDNLRAALRNARDEGIDASEVGRLAKALYEFWRVRGYIAEGRAGLDEALRCRGDSRDLLQMRLLNSAAGLACAASDHSSAQRDYEAALSIAQHLGDRARQGALLTNLGTLAQAMSRLDEAEGYHRRSIDVYADIGDRYGVAMAELNLADVLGERGAHEDSRRLLERCQPVFQQVGDMQRIATCLHNLGRIEISCGDPARGTELLQRSLELRRKLRHRKAIAATIGWLGVGAARASDDERAVRLVAAAEEICERSRIDMTRGDRIDWSRCMDEVRGRLGAAAFAGLWGNGASMSEDEAILHALDET